MKDNHSVAVIGAGIVGVATAAHLQKRGFSVLLLDKRGIAQGTSYGNSGILDTGYILPFAPPNVMKLPQILLGKHSAARISLPDGLKSLPWIAQYYFNSIPRKRIQCGGYMRPLVQNAVEEHKELLNKSEAIQYLKNVGRAKLYRTTKAFRAGLKEVELLNKLGVICNIYDAEEFSGIEPDLKPNYLKVITCKGSGRYTSPHKAIEGMAENFVLQGGKIKIDKVNALEQINDGWQINNQYHASNIVLCAGPWTNNITRSLGYKFPITMKRGYHRHYKTTEKLSHAIIDTEGGYVICPMEKGLRITTGVEFAGHTTPPNPVQIQQVLPKAQELINFEASSEEEVWLGARPCMADSLPVIGASKRYRGLWFNFGHGHVGLTAGPASGKLLAQMMVQSESGSEELFCDSLPYSPYRF